MAATYLWQDGDHQIIYLHRAVHYVVLCLVTVLFWIKNNVFCIYSRLLCQFVLLYCIYSSRLLHCCQKVWIIKRKKEIEN